METNNIQVLTEKTTLEFQPMFINVAENRNFTRVFFLDNYLIFFGKDLCEHQVLLYDTKSERWLNVELAGKDSRASFDPPNCHICADFDKQILFFYGCCKHGNRIEPFIEVIFFRDLGKKENLLLVVESFPQEKVPLRQYHTVNVVNGQMYLYGGMDISSSESNLKDELMVLNYMSDWSLRKYAFEQEFAPPSRYKHTSFVYKDKLYIYGGIGENEVVLNDLWSFDTGKLCWQKIANDSLRPEPVQTCYTQVFGEEVFLFEGMKGCGKMAKTLIFSLKEETFDQFEIKNMKFILSKRDQLLSMQGGKIYSLKKPNKIEKLIRSNWIEAGLLQVPNKSSNSLYSRRTFADVTFLIEGRRIQAHRYVLALKSLGFLQLFLDNWNEEVLEIHDIPGEVFEALLEFIYLEDLQFSNTEVALQLLKLTKRFCLPTLEFLCRDYLSTHIDVDNIVECSKLCQVNQYRDLNEAVLDFIRQNPQAFLDKLYNVNN